MAKVQRVFYVGVAPTPVDPQTGMAAHWVKFSGASGTVPSFPVNATMVGVGTIVIVGMYGLTGRLFVEGDDFDPEGFARIYAPQATELPLGQIDIFDSSVSTNTSYQEAVIAAAPDYFWRVDEITGLVADNEMAADGDLIYGADAGVYDALSSTADGTGTSKDIALVAGREIYDPASTATGSVFFSPDTYTGTGAALSVNTGLDMTSGGFIFGKGRSWGSSVTGDRAWWAVDAANPNSIYNFCTTELATTDAQAVVSVSNTGYNIGTSSRINIASIADYWMSWSFRNYSGYFERFTYTGNGADNRALSTGFSGTIGMIWAKKVSGDVGSWYLWHRGRTDGGGFYVRGTGTTSVGTVWNTTPVSGATVTLGDGGFGDCPLNHLGDSYVMYIFGHNDTADGLMQMGSYNGNGTDTGPTVTLGWRPQAVFIISAEGANDGNYLFDVARGFDTNGVLDDAEIRLSQIAADTAENTADNRIAISDTGFNVHDFAGVAGRELNAAGIYYYVAIRE